MLLIPHPVPPYDLRNLRNTKIPRTKDITTLRKSKSTRRNDRPREGDREEDLGAT